MARYYEWMSPVRLYNLENVPLLLHMRWKGERPSREICVKAQPIGTNVYVSHRTARLRLEGKDEQRSIFAILEIDLDSPLEYGRRITFSPVPFGPGGKPILPWKGYTLTTLLHIARAVLLSPEARITADGIAQEIRPLHIPGHEELSIEAAEAYLVELDRLHVTAPEVMEDGGIGHKVLMLAPQAFENIFGVNLP